MTQIGSKIGYGFLQVAVYDLSSSGGVASFDNINVEDFKGQLLSNLRPIPEAQASTYLLSNFHVKDVDLGKQTLLINFDNPTLVTIENSSFQRISNALMVLNIKKVEHRFTMTNCHFDNISSANIENLKDIFSLIENPLVGLCGTFMDTETFFTNVTFKTISYNCLSLIRSNFIFEKVSIDYTFSAVKPFQAWLDIENIGPMITIDETSSGKIIDSLFENYKHYNVRKGAVKLFFSQF